MRRRIRIAPPARGLAAGALPTLGEAIELHLRAMRAKRSTARSLDTLRETARHLGDWLARPLASLRRHEVAARHEELSASRAARGSRTAGFSSRVPSTTPSRGASRICPPTT